MGKDQNLVSSTDGELNYSAKDFNCRKQAVKLAKMVVGNTKNSVQEYIEEIRHNSEGKETVTVNIPRHLLFKD